MRGDSSVSVTVNPGRRDVSGRADFRGRSDPAGGTVALRLDMGVIGAKSTSPESEEPPLLDGDDDFGSTNMLQSTEGMLMEYGTHLLDNVSHLGIIEGARCAHIGLYAI